ncbi:MAG: hypothetical protein WC878_05535 [Candidatus Paceibacterota bacterium]|jgi:hypothetical protein
MADKKIQKTAAKAKIPKQKDSAGTPISKKTKEKKELVFAPGERCFWVDNGPALQSLLELRDALATMNEDQFIHHVNDEKNDFSSWVLYILQDEKCAKDLLKAKNMKAALKVVEKHLKEYEV